MHSWAFWLQTPATRICTPFDGNSHWSQFPFRIMIYLCITNRTSQNTQCSHKCTISRKSQTRIDLDICIKFRCVHAISKLHVFFGCALLLKANPAHVEIARKWNFSYVQLFCTITIPCTFCGMDGFEISPGISYLNSLSFFSLFNIQYNGRHVPLDV